jgi:aldose 1-epimerase
MQQPTLTISEFGQHQNRPVLLYQFVFPNELEIEIMNYGGIIKSLRLPDKWGEMADVVLGYPTLKGYLQDTYYQGALIGRYANRIARASFTLNGTVYKLTKNNGPNHLHGGQHGFNTKIWEVIKAETTADEGILRLKYSSADGEEGYPGQLNTTVTYRIRNKEVKIEYSATTSKTTPVSLSQHTYFNLSGNRKTDILEHKLKINASRFLPISENQIPLGTLKPTAYSPLDFRQSREVGKTIEAVDQQLEYGAGYDHYWVLDTRPDDEAAAELFEPESGRHLYVYTSEPGIQVYTGNYLPKEESEGMLPRYRHGLCLETQAYPDAPNQNEFPSTLLHPGEVYQSETRFRFSTR